VAAPIRDVTLSGRSSAEDARFRVLRLLEDNPEITQREISDTLGLSLGGVNYCLKGLMEKGLVKVQNFRTSRNKLAYAYILTPQGIGTRVAMTRTFLARRMAEYEALKDEISALEAEIGEEGDAR